MGLQDFFMFINSLRSSTQFTIEVKTNSMILFLDILLHWKGPALVTKDSQKTDPGHCLYYHLTICCM